jgi:Carboxypeptidase regulatory-like domain
MVCSVALDPGKRWVAAGVAAVAAVVAAIVLLSQVGDGDAPNGAARQRAQAPLPLASSGPGRSGTARVDGPLPTPGRGRVVGYVRDVNGNPLSGARVRIGGMRRGTRTNASGRYALRLPRRARTLVADHPTHARQAVTLNGRAVRRRLDFSLAATRGPSAAAPNSADALIFWTSCPLLAELTLAELDEMIGLGVDGFVCMAGRLATLGGTYRFARRATTPPAAAAYDLQRSLRGSAVVRLARRHRVRLYLGFQVADYYNAHTPFKDWFDDAAWSRDVLAPVRNLAAAARSLGLAGVAIDQELYPGRGGAQTASWSWDYPGNHHSEAEVRAQVERRGRQLMSAILAGYPGVDLVAYYTAVPGSWEETVQEVVNGDADALADDVRVDFWAGLSSVPGYAAIRWLDAVFYKTPHIGRDWSIALERNASAIYSLLSRRFPNWGYAASRLHVTPFSWINEGPSPSRFDDARDPAYVADQLAAFRTWGTGGVFANYAYRGPLSFDYGPYADAMRRASASGVVDQEPPRLSMSSPAANGTIDATGPRMDLAGTAQDNFAIRVVRWYNRRDGFGTAKLVWEPNGDPRTGGPSTTRWRISGVPLSAGLNRITIVAEDIKGLATVRQLTVRR